jgi:integrase
MTKERRDGTGSIYKAADGWRAQVRYFDTFTGKSKTVRRRARNRDQARALLRELLDGPTVTATQSDMTVADYLDIWAAESLPVSGVVESTQDQYRLMIGNPLKPTLGKVTLAKFTPREAERWLGRLDKARTRSRTPRATKATPKPKPIPGHLLSQSTKRSAYAVLTLAMQAAVRDGLIPANPLTDIKRPRKARTEVPVMTAAEVEKMLTAAQGSTVEPLIVFVANTGCRIGEALALRWADVDLDNSTATISRASITSATTKTAAGVRTVPLLPEVVAALKVQRSTQRADRLKMGPGWADTQGLIFTTGAGTPIDPHNARRSLRAVLRTAGLPTDRPWHTMRHSLATRLLNRGVPMPVVASILGHASIRTTVDIYGHAEPAISADALAEVMGR